LRLQANGDDGIAGEYWVELGPLPKLASALSVTNAGQEYSHSVSPSSLPVNQDFVVTAPKYRIPIVGFKENCGLARTRVPPPYLLWSDFVGQACCADIEVAS
jgi:hypothetical protein